MRFLTLLITAATASALFIPGAVHQPDEHGLVMRHTPAAHADTIAMLEDALAEATPQISKRDPRLLTLFRRCNKRKFKSCTKACQKKSAGGGPGTECIDRCIAENPKCKYKGSKKAVKKLRKEKKKDEKEKKKKEKEEDLKKYKRGLEEAAFDDAAMEEADTDLAAVDDADVESAYVEAAEFGAEERAPRRRPQLAFLARCNKQKFNTCTGKCHNGSGVDGVDETCIDKCRAENPRCPWTGV